MAAALYKRPFCAGGILRCTGCLCGTGQWRHEDQRRGLRERGGGGKPCGGLWQIPGQNLFLEYGQITLDTAAKTIQVTQKILATSNTHQYFWLEANEEPAPLLESPELEAGHMLILGYDRGADTLNLYNTKAFQALGVNGSYIAAWYQNQLWYPHMNPSLSFVVDGTEYKAGQLFASEQKNNYIEKRYQAKFTELDNKFSRLVTNTVYLASGAFTIDQEAGKLQITKRTLGAPENFHYFWLEAQKAPVAMADNTPLAPGGSNYPMRILAMDRRDSSSLPPAQMEMPWAISFRRPIGTVWRDVSSPCFSIAYPDMKVGRTCTV